MMYFLIISGILLVALFAKQLFKKNPETDKDPYADLRDDTVQTPDDGNVVREVTSEFDEKYYERCRRGEPYQLFMKFVSVQDCDFVQSMLYGDNIPSHSEHRHMNTIYGELSTVFPVQLWIMTFDYDRAFEIANQFVIQKSEKFKTEEPNAMETIKKVIGVLTSPYPITKPQEIMGLTIFPKAEREE